MIDVSIRAARAEDLEPVQALLGEAGLPLDGVADFFPANYAVAEANGSVIAAIGVERYGDDGLLRSAVVAEPHRGTGLGARLTEERMGWCRDQDMRAVYLLTTTAAPFFEHQGFRAVDRAEVPAEVRAAPEFATICPSSAVVMRRATL
jgi:amino-acid N-acetyltransferase